MIRSRNDAMGRFSVDLDITNNDDVVRSLSGDIPRDQVRSTRLRGLVDSGAAQLVLPESVARRLGLRPAGEAEVRYADGRTARRDIVTGVHLTCGERSGLFSAIVEPARQDALVGAIVMEALDLIIDCTKQALVPRDPERVIAEIE